MLFIEVPKVTSLSAAKDIEGKVGENVIAHSLWAKKDRKEIISITHHSTSAECRRGLS